MNGPFACLGGIADVSLALGLPRTDWSYVNTVGSGISFDEPADCSCWQSLPVMG